MSWIELRKLLADCVDGRTASCVSRWEGPLENDGEWRIFGSDDKCVYIFLPLTMQDFFFNYSSPQPHGQPFWVQFLQASHCICWSEPTRFRYFWFVRWPSLELKVFICTMNGRERIQVRIESIREAVASWALPCNVNAILWTEEYAEKLKFWSWSPVSTQCLKDRFKISGFQEAYDLFRRYKRLTINHFWGRQLL